MYLGYLFVLGNHLDHGVRRAFNKEVIVPLVVGQEVSDTLNRKTGDVTYATTSV